jgi:hypothetical protein
LYQFPLQDGVGSLTSITKSLRREKTKAPTRQKSVPAHTSAAARTKEELSPAKKLIALGAADKFGKAKTLIQQLDGKEFPTEVGGALTVLAKNYFPFRLDDTDKGVKFFLD